MRSSELPDNVVDLKAERQRRRGRRQPAFAAPHIVLAPWLVAVLAGVVGMIAGSGAALLLLASGGDQLHVALGTLFAAFMAGGCTAGALRDHTAEPPEPARFPRREAR